MHKYQGKYQAPRPKRRPFLYLGLGCAALALLAAAYVGLFFWTGAQRKQASRQTAAEYVVTLPPAPEQPSRETEPDTKTTAPSETTVPETTAETQPPRFPTVDFAGLQEKNPDVVAWIQIPALEGVDYPVVIGEDNAYYVNHNWENQESEEGAIFLDFRNQPDFSQPHNILYGHCMKDGTMFQPLGQWERESFSRGNDRSVLLYLPTKPGCMRSSARSGWAPWTAGSTKPTTPPGRSGRMPSALP